VLIYIGVHKSHLTNFKKNDLYFTTFHGVPNQPIITYPTRPETSGRYIVASDPSLDRSFQAEIQPEIQQMQAEIQQFQANVNAHDQYINAQDQNMNAQDEYIAANVDRAYGGPAYGGSYIILRNT